MWFRDVYWPSLGFNTKEDAGYLNMSCTPHACIVYGIRLPEEFDNCSIEDIFSYDFVNRRPALFSLLWAGDLCRGDDYPYLSITSSVQYYSYTDSLLQPLVVESDWDALLEKACAQFKIPYETPGWHVIVSYG